MTSTLAGLTLTVQQAGHGHGRGGGQHVATRPSTAKKRRWITSIEAEVLQADGT
jgi:hypothetical protein